MAYSRSQAQWDIESHDKKMSDHDNPWLASRWDKWGITVIYQADISDHLFYKHPASLMKKRQTLSTTIAPYWHQKWCQSKWEREEDDQDIAKDVKLWQSLSSNSERQGNAGPCSVAMSLLHHPSNSGTKRFGVL